MPLLVARQWPVLRRAPAAIGIPNRARRLYAQSSKSIEKNPDRTNTPHSAIIIPTSLETRPKHLFRYIKTLHWELAKKQTFCVFFVTPHYAPLLLNDDAFLQKAVNRAYDSKYWKTTRQGGLSIQALCAVVDKLPVPETFPANVSNEYRLSHRATKPPTAGTGFEGIAYAMLPAGASVPSAQLAPSDHGAIDFIIAEHSAQERLLRDTLRLPLANTVFQTGTPTTMILSQWNTNGAGEELELSSKTKVSHHGIRLVNSKPSEHASSVLNVPLIPLTVPRVVEGCMGNIIRRVVDSEGKGMQASAELENVVPRFFRSRGQPAQATVAWALVIPQELKETINARTEQLLSRLPKQIEAETVKDESWEVLWRSDPPVWNTLVSKALAEGARLHRVLSGGGGWGKKAGLLSLDPVPFNEARGPSGEDFTPMINDPEDFESTLTPVVRDGDSIQFFITPKSDLAAEAKKFDSAEQLQSIRPRKSNLKRISLELGTIPSTVDSIPGDSWQHGPWTEAAIVSFEGSFGALTEGGLTLTQHFKKHGDGARSVSTTTVDVPFTRFWAAKDLVERTKRHGSDEDPFQTSIEAKSISADSPQRSANPKGITTYDSTVSPQQLHQIRHQKLSSSLGRRYFSATAKQQKKPKMIRKVRSTNPLTPDQAPDHLNNVFGGSDDTLSETSWTTRSIDQRNPSHPPLRSLSKLTDEKGFSQNTSQSPPRLSVTELVNALGLTGVGSRGRLSVRTVRRMEEEYGKNIVRCTKVLRTIWMEASMTADERKRAREEEERRQVEEELPRRVEKERRRKVEESRTVFTQVKGSVRDAGVRIKKVAGVVKDDVRVESAKGRERERMRAAPVNVPKTTVTHSPVFLAVSTRAGRSSTEMFRLTKEARTAIRSLRRSLKYEHRGDLKNKLRASLWTPQIDHVLGMVAFAREPGMEQTDEGQGEGRVTERGRERGERVKGVTREEANEASSTESPSQEGASIPIRRFVTKGDYKVLDLHPDAPDGATVRRYSEEKPASTSTGNKRRAAVLRIFRLTQDNMNTILKRKQRTLPERATWSKEPSATTLNLNGDVLDPVHRVVQECSHEIVRLQNEVDFIRATFRRRARQAQEKSRNITAAKKKKAADAERVEMKRAAKKELTSVTLAESPTGIVRIRKMHIQDRCTQESANKALRLAEAQVYNLSQECAKVMSTIREHSRRAETYIERIVNEYGRLSTELQTQTQIIHGGILLRRDRSRPLPQRFSELQSQFTTTRNELSKILQRISLHAHIAHSANHSALSIYNLHRYLRIVFGRIIRSMLPRRHALRPQIHRLESRIFALRGFDDVLLTNRPGLEKVHVRRYLERLELGDKYQRMLNVKMEEGRRLREERNMRRATYGLRVVSGAKVRMTFGAPYVPKGFVVEEEEVAEEEEKVVQNKEEESVSVAEPVLARGQSPAAKRARNYARKAAKKAAREKAGITGKALREATHKAAREAARKARREAARETARQTLSRKARRVAYAAAQKPSPSKPYPRRTQPTRICKHATLPIRKHATLRIRKHLTLPIQHYFSTPAGLLKKPGGTERLVRRAYIESREEKRARMRKEQRKKGEMEFTETLAGWLEGGLRGGGEGRVPRIFGAAVGERNQEGEKREEQEGGVSGLDTLIETARGYEGKRRGGR